ncbi:SpoIIE family protein phosphatase [Streptomyces sp. Ru71]|uniref:SpoIIE family protein phosphatase n=1 Tax=Streptomyces sp. Ru71 TaxID=2080746 RepID=UPI000D1D0878
MATCLYVVCHDRLRPTGLHRPPPARPHRPRRHCPHARPALRRPAGHRRHPYITTDVCLPRGSVLVLFTDGLIEIRGGDLDEPE